MMGKSNSKKLKGLKMNRNSLKPIAKKEDKSRGSISIKHQLVASYVAFAIIPLITVSIVFYTMSRGTIRETSLGFASQLIDQTSMSLEYFLKNIEKKALNICIDPIIGDGLMDYGSDNILAKISASRNIERKLLSLSTVEDEVDNLYIIHQSGDTVGSGGKLSDEEAAFLEVLVNEKKDIWKKGLENDPEGIYYFRNIRNINTGKDVGTLKIKLQKKALIDNIKDLDVLEGAMIYLTDENGQMIYHPDENQSLVDETIWRIAETGEGEAVIGGHLISYRTLNNGWKLITEIPEVSLTSKLNVTTTVVAFLVILVAALAIVCGILISKNFSKPIIKMMRLMKAAEQGDMTVTMEEKRKDELGMLCISFNHMISNIRKLLEETQEVIGQTVKDSSQLKEATQHSVEAFKQLSLSIGEIAVGATSQAEETEKGTRAMYHLSSSIQDVMMNTNEIVNKSQHAKDIIQDTNSRIDQLNITMNSSMSVSKRIEASISDLSMLTKNIEEVMKMLDGISEQTNLLALNASIEAARAGEVGKGFAVVANEVRNLAEQSKVSTKSVRKTLSMIQDKTKEAALLVKDSNQIVMQQEESVKSTDEAFYNIIELLKNIDNSLQNVSKKVNGMEEIKDETLHKIEKISSVTSDTVAATQEVNALSEEQSAIIEQLFGVSNKLTVTMEQLSHSIERFKI